MTINKEHAVESPAHYDFGQMEAREIIEIAIDDLTDPATIYHTASALKYLLRASRKNGADDIAKARKHIVWAEAAARAISKCDVIDRLGYDPDAVAFRHGDIDKVFGDPRHGVSFSIKPDMGRNLPNQGIRDAGEFTQPPNCVHESTKSTNAGHVEKVDSKHPMHAVALEMAESAIPKRRGESAWGVSARKTGESAWEITLPLVTTKSDAAAHARQELIEGIARMNAMAEGHAYPKLAEAQTKYQTSVGN